MRLRRGRRHRPRRVGGGLLGRLVSEPARSTGRHRDGDRAHLAGRPAPLPRRRRATSGRALGRGSQVLRDRFGRGDPGRTGLVRRGRVRLSTSSRISSSAASSPGARRSGGPVEHGPRPRRRISILGTPALRSATRLDGRRRLRLDWKRRRSTDEPKAAGPTDVHQDDGRGRGRLGIVAGRAGPAPSQTAPERVVKDGMAYRRLGRTGPSRLRDLARQQSPARPRPLRTIVDRGVNYIDTSHNYDNGNAEREIGRLLKDVGRGQGPRRHEVPRRAPGHAGLHHGFGPRQPPAPRASTTIDVLMIHGAETAAVLVDERVLEAFERLKEEGAYRFRGLSCHANQDEVVRKAVDCGLYDVVQVGYNVFDIQETGRQGRDLPGLSRDERHPGPARAGPRRGVGVIAMKTLKVGGRRQDLAKYRTGAASLYQAMLKWVLDDARVASAVTEILNRQQMEEDLGAAGAKLTAAERTTLAPLRPRERDRLLPRLRPVPPGLPRGRRHDGHPSGARLPRKLRQDRTGPGTPMPPSTAEKGPRPAAIAGPAKGPALTASRCGRGSKRPSASWPEKDPPDSDLPGVADLQEECPVGPGDADAARAEPAVEDAAHRVVRVAQEQDRPGIELVGEQELREEAPGPRIDREAYTWPDSARGPGTGGWPGRRTGR